MTCLHPIVSGTAIAALRSSDNSSRGRAKSEALLPPIATFAVCLHWVESGLQLLPTLTDHDIGKLTLFTRSLCNFGNAKR